MNTGNGNGPTQNGMEADMIKRKYLSKVKNYEGEIVSAVVYYTEKPEDNLEANYHIEEVNHTRGRWMLTIGNWGTISDDFDALEKDFIKWMQSEGVDGIPASGFGPIDF